MKIKIQADPKSFTTKPTEKEFGGIKMRAQKGYEPLELTIDEIAELISKGHTISPAVMKGGMKSENFLHQQLFMVDIDNKQGKVITPEASLEICKNRRIMPVLYYETFSHTDEHPRFRLVFVCERVINDKAERDAIMRNLSGLFAQSDASCNNADKVFLGTNKKVVLL